tara:strand:- start:77 stop:274 length:198 start_codon:yes stop_codon:yes gene_type:complete
MYKQLTLMPMLDGHVKINKAALSDAAVMQVLTDLHDRNYQELPTITDRWYFNTRTGLARTATRCV